MRSLEWLGAVASLLVLAGCQIHDYSGSGPFNLSEYGQRYVDHYMGIDTLQKQLLITEGPKREGFIWRCPEVNCNVDSTLSEAVFQCELYRGKKCHLYADGNEVVWRFDGPKIAPSTAVPNEKSPPKITKKATTSDIKTRLRKLKELENEGLITKEDAARKRKELLEKL